MVLAGNNLFSGTRFSGEETRTATIIVAKDGSGDSDDIQEAINLLGPSGGVVYIREGIYTISSTITFPNNNISLVGSGRASQLYISENDILMQISKDGISVSNLYLNGSGSGASQTLIDLNAANKCFITDCWLENAGSVAIGMTGNSQNNFFSRNVVSNIGNAGILIFAQNNQTIQNVTISNNMIDSCGQEGILIQSLLIVGTTDVIYLNIIGNQITNCGTGGTHSGIQLDTAGASSIDQNIINNNQIHSNTDYGIDLLDANVDRTLIVGNIILNNTTGAIRDNGSNTTAANNIIA